MVVRWFGLRAGCDQHCSRMSGHDARAHEQYGRVRALAHLSRPLPAVVAVGPLVVDLRLNQVAVDGAEVRLSRIQTELVRVLAECPGRTYPHREIVERIWGVQSAELWARRVYRNGTWHGLRVHVTRLRQRLGSAGSLVENVPDRGYRLKVEPPNGERP